MELKHWQDKERSARPTIYIPRIISISEEEPNEIVITEECDEWFNETYTRQAAIQMLQEAIKWLLR